MGVNPEEEPGLYVAHGKRVTVDAVSHPELALVIGDSYIDGLHCNGPRAPGESAPYFLHRLYEAMALEDVRCGGGGGKGGIPGGQTGEHILGPPREVFPFLLHDGLYDLFTGPVRAGKGTSRPVHEAFGTF